MVSGEVLRLDVFGWLRVVAVDVEVVVDWRFDELVDGCKVSWSIVLLRAVRPHLAVPLLHWKSCKASPP
jgi:hypothetical protein